MWNPCIPAGGFTATCNACPLWCHSRLSVEFCIYGVTLMLKKLQCQDPLPLGIIAECERGHSRCKCKVLGLQWSSLATTAPAAPLEPLHWAADSGFLSPHPSIRLRDAQPVPGLQLPKRQETGRELREPQVSMWLVNLSSTVEGRRGGMPRAVASRAISISTLLT